MMIDGLIICCVYVCMYRILNLYVYVLPPKSKLVVFVSFRLESTTTIPRASGTNLFVPHTAPVTLHPCLLMERNQPYKEDL
jgi:hypothetical protein